ncbi:MAG TPA: tRNA glutamyl-Q(34) synthetase GluQRS [Gammaproteobacteria bacterium]|nr:tRNA glutamyl-Q(34) synthetase GluQRS [Gammaproteobacteria bacterium]
MLFNNTPALIYQFALEFFIASIRLILLLHQPLASGTPPQPSQCSPTYRGRFAPSPTGPLHFGSLATALGSYLDARAHGGDWLLRIEDLDPPREQPGAADAIMRMLEAHGLHWDGSVLFQHTRLDAYQAAVAYLLKKNMAYPCTCSRREIADSGMHGLEGPMYTGTCRNRLGNDKRAAGVRLKVPIDETFSFNDVLQGAINQHLADEIGDFIVRRVDGHFAYQLAVVLDDAFQGINHVVRGADLLISTPRQIYLQHLFGLPTPEYMHLPVAVDTQGAKISKQTQAAQLDGKSPSQALCLALQFLGQSPLADLQLAAPHEVLSWAVSYWQPNLIKGVSSRRFM